MSAASAVAVSWRWQLDQAHRELAELKGQLDRARRELAALKVELRTPLHAEISRLREQLAERDETIRQLKTLMAPVRVFPRAWRLTPSESRMLAALDATPHAMTKEALHLAATDGVEPDAELKIVDVFVCKLRRKLPDDVAIETVWGTGYRLPKASRTALARHTSKGE